MLSTRIFTSSDAATNYYAQGDYYGTESQGTWAGKGSKELGLEGEFNAKSNSQFSDLLKGIMPNGQILAKKTKDKEIHCPGIDLTFSAPKSFSIQMLIYATREEKQEMKTALTKAVNNTLDVIEKNAYVVARKGHAGEVKEPINKLIFSTFMHTTNRNLEPQAHVHCLLANAAKCEDGKFRSISFDKILKNNKFFGQVFRNELAIETKKLGFEITPTILSDGSSSFELSKIDQKLIDGFSTRRQEIEELCKLYNVTTKEGRDNIVINSRKSKKIVKEEELTNAWNSLEKKITQEIEVNYFKQSNKENNNDTNNNNNNDIKTNTDLNKANTSLNKGFFKESFKGSAAFSQALEFISKAFSTNHNKTSEREVINEAMNQEAYSLKLEDLANLCVQDITHYNSTFSKEDLYSKTLKFAIGNYTFKEIEEVYKLQEKNGALLKYKDLYTSKALLLKEKQILKYAKNSIGSSKSIIEEKHFTAHFDRFCRRELSKNSNFKMNDQQKSATKYILTSDEKIITVVGLPGVGKSTILNAVRDIAEHKISKIINLSFTKENDFSGLAPTASAAKTLTESAKVESNTIYSFLGKCQGYLEGRGKNSLKLQNDNFKNTIIFVDEASLIPTQIMHKLLSLQEMFGFRVVLSGDTKQLSAVEAGKPFEQMLAILSPIVLDQIVRQEDAAHRDAIIAASSGRIQETFAIHANHIHVKEDLSIEVANNYLQSSNEKRKNTLLISPTRNLRDNINDNIRQGLQLENSLKEEIKKFTALRQKDMSIADYQYAPSFQIGDILKFHKSYKNIIGNGEYLKVKQSNHLRNNLILLKSDGREVIFTLKSQVNYQNKFEVFQTKELELQEGLKIIFTKNNREYGLVNSETAIIKKINDSSLLLQFENNLTKEIPLTALQHIDYGYCITVHSSQGKTFDHTTAAINNHLSLNDQKSWLVTLSRHRKELNLFVEDKEKLAKNLNNNDGNQLSAIDLESLINSVQKALQETITQKGKQLSISNATRQNNIINQVNKQSKSNEYTSKIDKIHDLSRYSTEHSAHDIHNMLSNNLESLTKQLLPFLSNKKIIKNKSSIQCGSISIALAGNKRGLWTRFSTGQKGNLFDLIKESQGLPDKQAAIEWSKNYLGLYESNFNKPNIDKINSANNNEKIESLNIENKNFTKLIPAPNNATRFNPGKTFHYLLKNNNNHLEAVYEYRNIKNELCGYVVRIRERDSNKKKTLPIIYVEDNDGKRKWVIKGFDNNRCLYNEHKLAKVNKPILIVEGEKAADSASKQYPELTVLSWCGGAQGYSKSNWSILQGRDVIIWPDNDKAGAMAANGIKQILESEKSKVKSCKIIDLTKLANLPEKWDLADQLSSSIERHQITGLLLSEAKIADNIRIDRTVREYLYARDIQLQRDIQNTKFNNMNDHYALKYKHEVYLSNEEKYVRERLKTTSIISNLDQIKIISDAKIEAHNNSNLELNANQYAAKQLWEEQKLIQTDKMNVKSADIRIEAKATQMELKI